MTSSPYEPFTLSVVPERGEVVLVPSGDLDLSSAEEVGRQARELRASGFATIVIDLRQIGFLDSSALRMLLALRNDAKRARQTLALIPGPPEVQRIFELTATRTLFDWRSGG